MSRRDKTSRDEEFLVKHATRSQFDEYLNSGPGETGAQEVDSAQREVSHVNVGGLAFSLQGDITESDDDKIKNSNPKKWLT